MKNLVHVVSRGAPALLVALLVPPLVFGAGCPAERRGLSRDSLLKSLDASVRPGKETLPALEELARLRVPAPATLPPDLKARAAAAAADPSSATPLERARLAVAVDADLDRAAAAWAAEAPPAEKKELLAHRCLVEEAVRRYDLLVQACGAFVDAAPADPRAALAVLVLQRASTATGKVRALFLERGERWVEGCRASRAKGHSCADLARVVAEVTAQAAAVEKDEARARRAIESGGFLTKASVAGPFEGEVHEALARERAGEKLALRPDRGVVRTLGAWDGRFRPSERGERGVYRLVFSGRGAGPATLYATSSVPMRVRVDGVLLLDRDPQLRFEPRTSRVGVTLAPGVHRVELVAASYGRGDDISVALLGVDGAPALDPLPPDGPANGKAAPAPAPSGAVEGAPLVLDDPPLAALDRLQWRHVLARSGALGASDDDARLAVRQLLAQVGYAPQALAVAAQAIGDDPTMPPRLSSSTAQALWSRVLARWPDHPVALLTKARDLREERPDEALAAFRALVEARPDYPFGWRDLAGLALERGLLDEALAAAERLLAVESSPDDVDAAAPALRRAGQIARAQRLERARARMGADLYSMEHARWLLDAGRTDEAVAELSRIVAAEPGHFATEQLWDLLELRAPEDALAKMEQHLKLFPNDVGAWRRRARLVAHLRGPQAGVEAVERALDRFGSDEQLRRAAEELGAPTVWSARLALGDDVVRARRARKDEPFPGHPVVMLLDHAARHIYADESSIVVRHWIAELKTKEVLDGFGEIGLGRDERLLRLRVVKPDGSVLEPEHHRNVEDISLTGLQPGDLVEFLSITYDRGPLLLGTSFETRTLDAASPALAREYEVTMPPGFAERRGVSPVVRNGAEPPVVADAVEGTGRKRVRWTFRATDVAAMLDEPHAPSRDETARLVGFQYGLDDDAWAWVRGRAVHMAARSDAWLVESARRIAGQGSARARFERLFAFVAERIEEAPSADDALQTLGTGRGARTPLLYALARAVDLDVEPVGVDLPTAPPPDVPDPSRFRLVGLRASLEDGDAYAFVDGGLAVLDGLPPRLRGARVLSLARQGAGQGRVRALPDAAISDEPVRVQLDLDAKGAEQGAALEGILVVTVPRYMAESMRRGFRSATAEQLEAYLERALGDSLPGVQVADVRAPALNDAGAPLVVGARVQVPLPGAGSEPVRFEHLFSHGAAAPLALMTPPSSHLRVAERRQPLIVAAEREVLEVEIALPKGAAFTEAPSGLALDAGPFRLEQRAEVTDGTLYWTRTLQTRNARVPAGEWPALRTLLTQLVARADARVSFLVPEDP